MLSRLKRLSLIAGSAQAFLCLGAGVTGAAAAEGLHFTQKEIAKPPVLLKIDDEEFTEEKLAGEKKLGYGRMKKKEYEFRMLGMRRLLVEKLIGAKAKEAGMTLREFIDKKVVGDKSQVSDGDFKKFVAEKELAPKQVTEKRSQIMSHLQDQKREELVTGYLNQLSQSRHIEVYFKKPEVQLDVSAEGSPSFGGADSPVTLIEFSDFQCPYCSKAAKVIGAIKKKYAKKVRVVFRHFPLQMHKDARPAAEAAFCVNSQGSDKFWKFHDLAFKNQDKLDRQSLQGYAVDSGADAKTWKECIESSATSAKIQAEIDYAVSVGISGTPTFVMNGHVLDVESTVEAFSKAIDEELQSVTTASR